MKTFHYDTSPFRMFVNISGYERTKWHQTQVFVFDVFKCFLY